jgi:type I restriction-modification system DNA methylase subunit
MLDYPIGQRDSQGSRFWYLRAGNSLEEAKDTCPIAVGFYQELNKLSPEQASQWLVEQDSEIRGHYLNRVAEDKPVMYLLLPQAAEGTIAMILPTESKLRQRSIQTFSSTDGNIASQLARLHWSILADKVLDSIIGRIPQVDWIFYKSAQSAYELAQLLAKIALKIEFAVSSMYHDEPQNGYLHKLLESFQKELLPNLKLTGNNDKDYSFADIYAQTIAYGLFTARVFGYIKEPNQDFNRANAAEQLPETNPFLKQLFEDISKSSVKDLGDELIDAIAEALEILRAAKMDAILSDFRHKMNREDIVIRFYEDFLAAYKPKMRERRGVYYTPEPVVSYMVRSVDLLVSEKFNKPLGLADPEVMILDPACGTGTFLLWIFQLIYQKFQEEPALLTEGLEDKSWSTYVKERLLPRIFGFELLMAPYAICHLKLGLFLEETGYKFDSGRRLGVYLTNTLEDVARKQDVLLKEFIAQESDAATEIKRDLPIMLVIGNPPYSGHSENNNSWIKSLVNDYYFVDGKTLGEKNPKWLQDDYVKFIRFAQWRIDQSSQGILAFISNHGFLDNPTFRGMRQSLINSFDGITVYDLHGNSKKKEKQSDGRPDENVFDIQQGVAITLAVKTSDIRSPSPLVGEGLGERGIKHSHLFGSRETKYQVLSENTIKSTDFTKLTPQSEFYLLTPQDSDLFSEYGRYWKITDMMPINVLGF